eukprot:XP_001706270.1 Hypothetical protein GL50803_20409 [Giardia lamblia ATCC 50803]
MHEGVRLQKLSVDKRKCLCINARIFCLLYNQKLFVNDFLNNSYRLCRPPKLRYCLLLLLVDLLVKGRLRKIGNEVVFNGQEGIDTLLLQELKVAWQYRRHVRGYTEKDLILSRHPMDGACFAWPVSQCTLWRAPLISRLLGGLRGHPAPRVTEGIPHLFLL